MFSSNPREMRTNCPELNRAGAEGVWLIIFLSKAFLESGEGEIYFLEELIMKFSQLCDRVENTEQEQQLLQFFKCDDMKEVANIFKKMTRVPVFGKLFSAVIALGDYESISSFKQSKYYNNIKDWNFEINFGDKKSLSIGPSELQQKKAMKIFAVVSIIITLIILYRKFCYRKKNKR